MTKQAFPFKNSDPLLSIHPIEKRGFVTVPFDYRHPDQDTVSVFYRLIPARGHPQGRGKEPIIVIINGGPGIASSAYRPLDFDYANLESPKNGSLNRFRYLLGSYRILLVDQRGTDGQSAPLDMSNPKINANGIAHYFSSDSQARDYLAVIVELIPRNEKFFMIAQSYGGMVGMQYLSLPQMRRPQGIVFSCSAVPYENVMDAMLNRRAEQLKLNHELKVAVPHIESKLKQLRSHFSRTGINPEFIHALYPLLGKDVKGIWESKLVERIDKLLTEDKQVIEKEIQNDLGGVNLLNYVLSSANFTPGMTDRTCAKVTSEQIPFEPWMIDENWMLNFAGEDGTWREAWVKEMDKNPPPPTPFASLADLNNAISKNQVLFTAADNDAFVPKDAYLRAIQKFQVVGHTQIETLPGGHHAIFSEEGFKLFKKWSERVPADSKN